MKKTLLLAALLATLPAAAQASAASDPTAGTALHQRYCDKLRAGAVEYVQFVRRLAPIYGYTYADFAPAYPGAPVKADCRVPGERLAAVRRLLQASAAPARP
jgi:hypothetical protein